MCSNFTPSINWHSMIDEFNHMNRSHSVTIAMKRHLLKVKTRFTY